MKQFRYAILAVLCLVMGFFSVWVPLRGKLLQNHNIEIVSYHWIWNTERIYSNKIFAIPTQIDFSRQISTYIAIITCFALIYFLSCIVQRKMMLASQSEIEQAISSENLKCSNCMVEPMVGIDGKNKEVLLLCPECETEWYLRRQSIDETIKTLRACLTEQTEKPIALIAKRISKRQHPL